MSRLVLPPVTAGETAVVGLGRSGIAASELLLSRGYQVYAFDDGDSDRATSAAAALSARGASVQIGGHDVARIARASLVVVSPGVPPDSPAIVAARDSRREIVSEIELALRCGARLRYIAVTGTNGKTTTTALIGHMLRGLGVDAPDAGNIGTPLSEIVGKDPLPDWVSLELSSFQLHDTPSIAPNVGVLTNLSPDHLDRYASVADYFADKALMFRNATDESSWVVNADDPASMDMARGVQGKHHFFSVMTTSDAWYDRGAGQLAVNGQVLLARSDVALLGDHNVANVLAAALAVMSADAAFATGAARTRIADAIKTFRALDNRLEVVGEWNGVEWINDSKATNVASTLVAVRGMTRPTILLLGGRHKGEPYTGLAESIAAHVKHVIAFGESKAIVEHDLSGVVPLTRIDGSFEEVMAFARSVSAPGDAVLLSPACSSYDMFNNYVERGARFRALAAAAHG
ncbi:MAG: UDP-N-acetylmuramoyl-L-alanine--D-glutamate ligase [Gemmatimonadaceae bacterium]